MLRADPPRSPADGPCRLRFLARRSRQDDVVLFTDDTRARELTRFHFLRQQWERQGQSCFRSLADYIAPRDSGRADYLGAFVVTAGIGADALAAQFEAAHDDYHAILVKALADRLAEALAECLHQQARTDWGYGRAEELSQRAADCRSLPRDSTRPRLSGLPRSHGEADAFRTAGRGIRNRRVAHRDASPCCRPPA